MSSVAGIIPRADSYQGIERDRAILRERGIPALYLDDRSIGIIFDGELYNSVELRRDLQALGCRLRSDSSAELVLQLYQKHGTLAFAMLNGAFTFAVLDDRSHTVILVRDPLGVMPLYLFKDGSKIVFSSRLNDILAIPELDLNFDPYGIRDFLVFGYVQAPLTCFQAISRLEAGTYVKATNGVVAHYRYWEPEYCEPYPAPSLNSAKEEFLSLLEVSLKYALSGKVGLILDGSLGARSLAYLAQRSGEKFAAVTLDEVLKEQEMFEQFDDALELLDEPLADPSLFPLCAAARELKQVCGTVVCAAGSHEILAGYARYAEMLSVAMPYQQRFGAFLDRSSYWREGVALLRDQHLAPRELRHWKYFDEQPLLNGMLAYDTKTYLPECTLNGMHAVFSAHGLHVRAPFLDRRVFEYLAKLPQAFKLNPNGIGQWLLREALQEHLPSDILTRHLTPAGFSADKFVSALREKVRETLSDSSLNVLDEVLNMESLRDVVQGYYDHGRGSPVRVWNLFLLCAWTKGMLGRKALSGLRRAA